MTTETTAAVVDQFWTGIDPSVAATLSDDQRSAISDAVQSQTAPPADIRLSFGKYFLVMIFGRERRTKERVKSEAKHRPVVTTRNALAIFFIWIAMMYMTLTLLGAVTWVTFNLLG